MTFVWLTPLVIFVLFTGVVLLQEGVRRKSLADYQRELYEAANRAEPEAYEKK
ncbi:MAG TPA: hypothetical protein VG754_00140 [Verrucomicrobiae bacterium]|jgi:hypothetical protein|nr:hypothetical protein [Verrucomicrobiae bacterium]